MSVIRIMVFSPIFLTILLYNSFSQMSTEFQHFLEEFRKMGEFVYPVRVSWSEHTYEKSVIKLTDEDRAIATNKGWTLVEG